MSFTHVGGTGIANSVYHNGSLVLPYSPTTGNLIVYGAVVYGGVSSPTFLDSASNALTMQLYQISQYFIYMGWEIVPAGITGITGTWGSSGPIACAFIDEFQRRRHGV